MNNKTRFLWLYSTVLFTAAFVLIFMSAVSQNRLSKDVKSYKEQLTKQQGLFQGVQKSLSELTEENRQLQEKVKEEEDKNKEYEQQIIEMNKKLDEANTQKEMYANSMENLLLAKKYYDEKKYRESAACLEKVNKEMLSENAKYLYDSFADTVYKKVAIVYYNEGYKNYSAKKFNEAADSFEKSLSYKKDEYCSDDALYYLAMSRLKIKDINQAKFALEQFKSQYPSSGYIKDVERLLNSINNN